MSHVASAPSITGSRSPPLTDETLSVRSPIGLRSTNAYAGVFNNIQTTDEIRQVAGAGFGTCDAHLERAVRAFHEHFDRALVVTSAKAENMGSVDVMSANRIKAVRASVPSAASDNFVLGQAKSSLPGPIR